MYFYYPTVLLNIVEEPIFFQDSLINWTVNAKAKSACLISATVSDTLVVLLTANQNVSEQKFLTSFPSKFLPYISMLLPLFFCPFVRKCSICMTSPLVVHSKNVGTSLFAGLVPSLSPSSFCFLSLCYRTCINDSSPMFRCPSF